MLENMVYQGIVLGPTLWNVFFADVILATSGHNGAAKMFADDLNLFKLFERSASSEEIVDDMGKSRQEIYRWGKRNRVTFDESKEHFIVIHPQETTSMCFNLALSSMFNC